MKQTAFSQKVARNISPLFYQDAGGHHEQRKASGSTLQNQNCTGSHGIVAYTNVGFVTLYHENEKEVLLFNQGKMAQPYSTEHHILPSLLHRKGFIILSFQILKLLETLYQLLYLLSLFPV